MRKIRCSVWITFNLALALMQSVTGTIVLDSMPEDGKLNFTQLAIKYGHKCDEYDVVTEDGYILKLFNVRGDKNRPVYLQHGLLDSADTFIIRERTSLVIALADKGFNVWVGNSRGNKYGRRHQTLDADEDEDFWDFSQHEMGIYDLPAMIDYVLHNTGQKQLPAIGHSQGTMTFYILAAEKPEYNDKIELFISLAPICYLHNMKPIASSGADIWPLIEPSFEAAGIVDVFASNSLWTQLYRLLCSQILVGYILCSPVLFGFAGADPSELGPGFLPTVVGHFPAGASTKNVNHLTQIFANKRFCKYDYGEQKNREIYGTPEPPNYNLENIRMAIALLAASNDNLSTVKDVDLLSAQLKNVVYYHVMERKQFNHIDYVWGKHMTVYLFPIIFDLLQDHKIKKNYTEEQPCA